MKKIENFIKLHDSILYEVDDLDIIEKIILSIYIRDCERSELKKSYLKFSEFQKALRIKDDKINVRIQNLFNKGYLNSGVDNLKRIFVYVTQKTEDLILNGPKSKEDSLAEIIQERVIDFKERKKRHDEEFIRKLEEELANL